MLLLDGGELRSARSSRLPAEGPMDAHSAIGILRSLLLLGNAHLSTLCPMSEHDARPERRYPAHQAWRRVHNRSVIVFVTVCTRKRQPLLATEAVHQALLDAWAEADSWMVGRYVVMPDHVHLFASPRDPESPDVRRWIQFWKGGVTKRGPLETGKSLWQRDGWDRQLRTGDSYTAKWEYVRSNPVRHGLVRNPEDWPYQGELNEWIWHD